MKLFVSLVSLFGLSEIVSASVLGLSGLQLTDQTNSGSPIYVNAYGEVVNPQRFEWGGPAIKEMDAAKPRKCGQRLDASGRLGKRQTCPGGYTAACPGSYDYPCCPSSSPTCCAESSGVCCGADQFCQGYSTCCTNGQTGCGEACCNAGETCCGTNCCSTGFVCTDGACTPPGGYGTLSSTSISSIATPSSTPAETRAETGTVVVNATVTRTETGTTVVSNTSPLSSGSSSSSTTSSGGSGGNDNGHSGKPSPGTLGGAIGGSLGGALLLCCAGAWLIRRRRTQVPPTEEKPTEYTPAGQPNHPTEQQPSTYNAPTSNYEAGTTGNYPVTGASGNLGTTY
ncbi:hypothetical protein FRB91_008719 [Serendipita sp. 411]|nr:hypothetical protein FRB91_008719 [Serendipita sp. 411]